MSRVEGSGRQPRAMIHKRILQSAARDPDAAMDQIADEVSGATLDLVEKVLEEYGDPAEQAAEATADAGANPMSTNGTDEPIGELDTDNQQPSDDQASTDDQRPADDQATMDDQPPTDGNVDGSAAAGSADSPDTPTTGSSGEGPGTAEAPMNTDHHGETDSERPDAAELTDKQLATLECVFDNPDTTQGTIADLLDVTRATVSRRLNDIDGFDWSDREAFARAVLPEDRKTADEREQAGSPDATEDASDPASADSGSVSSGGPGDAPSTATETSAVEAGETVDADEPAEPVDAVEAVEARVTDLETAIERLSTEAGSRERAVDADPELVHKVLAACMESERLDDADERRVVELLMTGSERSG